MDRSSYAPFNLGLRHHAFGPYAPHLQYYMGIRHHGFGPHTPHLKAAEYKYKNIFLFLSSLVN
jgi:hypothetical protein